MKPLEIVEVHDAKLLKEFVNLPWKLYRNHPNWAPPLKKEMLKLLDGTTHPFWKCADRTLFLARRGSENVGRIAAIVDWNFVRYHRTATGYWGFFESIDDEQTAEALFARAEDRLRQKGMSRAIGPFNPSTNYEIGLLIEGFEHPATFMMPYNPEYYTKLVKSAGYVKEKDLLSLIVDRNWEFTPWVRRLVDRLKQNGEFGVRTVSRETFREDVHKIKEIYDECWCDNWGFVPMTTEEIDEMADGLYKIADLDLTFFIERGDELIGTAVIVPDINPLLKRLNGKIGLLGLLRYLRYRSEIRGLRGLLFGLKEKYRNMGVPFLALDHIHRTSRQKTEYQYLELGWNLEENEEINILERDLGARTFKRYRIYSKQAAIL